MALPSLNATPKYELTIPSTGEKIRFRPFLVKEQKVLLLAYESQDKKQIIEAILDTVKACADDGVDVYELATFDIDYIFTQIRAKSVGEKVDLNIPCSECNHSNEVQVNLEDITVDVNKSTEVVQLTDDISIKMRYPDYRQFMSSKIFEIETAAEMIMEVVICSIESIMTEEENILAKDESREELINFIESMSSSQFKKISDFVESMPVMKHTIEFTCAQCAHENKRTLQGIDDFF